MTAPNRNALWGQILVEELVAAGVTAVCLAPGSRSTPLAVAVAAHPDVEAYSHLDERSAAFFALGRGRRTGEPTALVCTSGTAAANFHPAVIEADEGRVPLVVCTADRPPELQDSGANQTVDQAGLYGDAVRWARTLPEPEAQARKLRSLRVSAARAVAAATGTPPGPVHLNVPFRKPLEPVEVPDDVPADLAETAPLGADGREGPFVRTTRGRPTLPDEDVAALARAFDDAGRPLVVSGPANETGLESGALAALLDATGAPALADPLSGHRFGDHVAGRPICGGYDAYLEAAAPPDPDLVVRFGASPTSKALRQYLRDADARQVVVDPAGGWREATFTATDLVTADPTALATALADGVSTAADPDWRDRFETAETRYWDLVGDAVATSDTLEGSYLQAVASHAPDPATVFVSNSMPVRDFDRFARPRAAAITALGNRGASGIDGIASTALGAGSATADPLVCVVGDLAYYHDMNGLLAVGRCAVDATIVLIDNDGGGIFHKLPIEAFDPPFTALFKTPHGLDFAPTGDLYGLEFGRVDGRDAFVEAFEDSIDRDGTQVIAVEVDAAASHREREELETLVGERIG